MKGGIWTFVIEENIFVIVRYCDCLQFPLPGSAWRAPSRLLPYFWCIRFLSPLWIIAALFVAIFPFVTPVFVCMDPVFQRWRRVFLHLVWRETYIFIWYTGSKMSCNSYFPHREARSSLPIIFRVNDIRNYRDVHPKHTSCAVGLRSTGKNSSWSL